jgi:LysM repeat protein
LITYTVQVGDTLFSIAQRFGVTVDVIIRTNNITDPNAIFVGQTLRIPVTGQPPTPPPAPPGGREITYIVRPGDTLTIIARRFGTTVSAIVSRNRITNPNFIQVGQTLIIPVIGVPTPPPAPPIPPIPIPPTPPTPPTPSEPPIQRRDSTVVEGLRFVLRVDKAIYRRGEPIVMFLIKTNFSNRTIRLDYRTSQRVEFRLRTGGQIVWTWSDGRIFAQVEGTETFRPGETKVYREVFTDTSRLQVGVYRLVGWNLATPQERLDVEFRITR